MIVHDMYGILWGNDFIYTRADLVICMKTYVNTIFIFKYLLHTYNPQKANFISKRNLLDSRSISKLGSRENPNFPTSCDVSEF